MSDTANVPVRQISRSNGDEKLVSLEFAATRVARYWDWPYRAARDRLLAGESLQTISFIYRLAAAFPPAVPA